MRQITHRLKKVLREPLTTPEAAASGLQLSSTNPADSLAMTSATVVDHESNLERLPAEVRRAILSVLDLDCLNALICASPIFHQQYLLDRRLLLAKAINTTLGSASIDAHAVLISKSEACRTVDDSNEILQAWRVNVQKKASRHFVLSDAVNEDEAVSMASFYSRTIVPIAKHFACSALGKLKMGETNFDEHALSTTEWQRLARAIYRFQLLCHVAYPPSSRNTVPDNFRHVFHTIEPWEVEELYSFYQFAEDIYDKIFDRIRDDLHPNHPRFADQERPPTPEGAFQFDNSWARRNFIEGTILRGGLKLLSTTLFDARIRDKERLVSLMQQSIVSSYAPISEYEGVLGESQQTRRREQDPSLCDRMTEERAACPFVGDDVNEPPLAWTLIWSGTYSNLYGEYIPNEIRQWGYVFWDEDTLRKHGAEQILAQQWEARWDEDPREEL